MPRVIIIIVLAACALSCKSSRPEAPSPQVEADIVTTESPKVRAPSRDTPAPTHGGAPVPDAPLPLAERPPVSSTEADLDRDGTAEVITLWCNADEDQEEEGKLIIKVGDAIKELEPSLSDMVDCHFVVTKPKRGPRLLWVVASEHEEAGPSTYYLMAYQRGQLELLWDKSAAVTPAKDNTWSIEEWSCDAQKKKETTTTTSYRFAGGDIKTKKRQTSKPIDPAICETSDP